MLDKFAQELKQIRELKGLSLQQLAIKTKIDIKFLEAIESGDFEFLPELYVKAFIKDYARALDLDQNLYLKKYETAKSGGIFEDVTHPAESVPPPEPVKTHPPASVKNSYDAVKTFRRMEDESSSSRKRKMNSFYYAGIGVVILVVLVVLYISREPDEIVVPEKPYEEIIEDTKERYSAPGENAAAEPDTRLSPDTLRLTIRANDTSWIRIVLDDSKSEEFILLPGSQKIMKAHNNYKLLLGNAGGIQFLLNEKPLNYRANPGSVQRVQIDSAGIKKIMEPTVVQE